MGALPLFAAAIPREYAMPMGAILFHLLFLQWAAFQDEPKSLFNCYVRAQSNILENSFIYLGLLAMSSLTTPVVSGAAGVLYTCSRVAYFKGYTTGDPRKRMRGNFGYLGLLYLLGASVYSILALGRVVT